MHDETTGLYNRRQFFKILSRKIRDANKHKTPTGLLIIEIQRFRKINVTYGYAAGDEVLRSVAELLKKVQRSGDYLARVGDDCFALLLTRLVNPGHAQLAAFKIHRLLELPFEIKDERIRCDAEIGIAISPLHTSHPEGLLKIAENALVYAKSKNQKIGILENHEESAISNDWDIEYELGGAIQRTEISVFFQPKVSIADRPHTPTGAEALVRWNSKSHGIVSPGTFLPIAERMGILKPLTNWILNSAIRLSRNWTRKWGQQTVSVNMPPQLVAQPDFVDLVLSTKNLWLSENVTLCLEILEQSIVADASATFLKLKELRENGIKIAIDDFGTGYSSLAYFRDIPADELKIDKSFVSQLLQDKVSLNIVNLVIDLAHRFDLSVVAEGVEDQDTLKKLIEMSCDQAQGYFYSKPLPADQFVVWLEGFGRDAGTHNACIEKRP